MSTADVGRPQADQVTMIMRPEDGVWKIVHRDADPITTAQPAGSILQPWPSKTGRRASCVPLRVRAAYVLGSDSDENIWAPD